MQIEKNMQVQRIHIFTFYYYKKIFKGQFLYTKLNEELEKCRLAC